jgi:hypothetical protein
MFCLSPAKRTRPLCGHFEEGDQVLSEAAIEGSAATDGLDKPGARKGRPTF